MTPPKHNLQHAWAEVVEHLRHNANHMTFFANRHMGQQGASQASTPAAYKFYHEPDHGSEHEC